jgi:hypothetical protein
MRVLTVLILTLMQFTAVPFIAMVAANSERQEAQAVQLSRSNVTTIYKIAPL